MSATINHRIQQTSTSVSQELDPVLRYANDVVAGRIVAGPLVRLACKRHLKDLEQGSERGLQWSLEKALRAINFFHEVLWLPESNDGAQKFILRPWQQFVVGSLFGWLGPSGYRRFRTAYVEIGKGNGKSPMAGGIGLYMLAADGEMGAQCFAAAVTRDQAGILFQDAVKMVDASPALSARIHKSGNKQVFNLAHLPSGSYFRPVSSEGRGLDGKRVHFAALDEIHEHPTPIVVQKMERGTKGRRQALILEITNSGYDRKSICWDHHRYSEQVLEGVFDDDKWFSYVCSLDDRDDWRDPNVWEKVNPNVGISIGHEYLADAVKIAQNIPSQENIVKRLNFCIWTEQQTRWMPMKKWDACAGAKDGWFSQDWQALLESLSGETCYGGLDLSLTTDLSALILLFPPSKKHDKWVVLPFYWVPEEDMVTRSTRDHVPYEVWVKQGFITKTPGNTVDHDFIENRIRELRKQYNIVAIAHDPALSTQLVTHLKAEKEDLMVHCSQQASNIDSGIRTLEKHIISGDVLHGGHPVLRWNANNAVTVANSDGRIKFDKGRSTERIDGLSATANAEWLAARMLPPKPGAPRITIL